MSNDSDISDVEDDNNDEINTLVNSSIKLLPSSSHALNTKSFRQLQSAQNKSPDVSTVRPGSYLNILYRLIRLTV